MELDGRKEKDGGGPIIQPAKCVLLFKPREIIAAQLFDARKTLNLNIFEFPEE